jgi:hypothetical protein
MAAEEEQARRFADRSLLTQRPLDPAVRLVEEQGMVGCQALKWLLLVRVLCEGEGEVVPQAQARPLSEQRVSVERRVSAEQVFPA